MLQTLTPSAADSPPYSHTPPTVAELAAAQEIVKEHRLTLVITGWSSRELLSSVLQRFPDNLLGNILAIPDKDSLDPGELDCLRDDFPALTILSTRFGGGEGRRLKLAMRHAIQSDCEILVTLNAAAGPAPEYLARLLAPMREPDVALVIASRLPDHADTIPNPHRWNLRAATSLQNKLLKCSLGDPHSGYRAYRAATLAALPFEFNSDRSVMEAELVIQHLIVQHRIEEVPVPASPGPDDRRRGLIYALQNLRTVLRALANRLHLVYHPKFDLEEAKPSYSFKSAPGSLHQYIIRRHGHGKGKVADVGAGSAGVSQSLHEAGSSVVAIDHRRPDHELPFDYIEADLDQDFGSIIHESLEGPADTLLALDVIEHLQRPEHGIAEIHRGLSPGGTLVASTANIAYLPIRLSLALGQFNYGKRGILDVTHCRLFTIRSFCRALESQGFRIDHIRGFGPPIRDTIGDSFVLRWLDRIAGGLAWIWPSMFSFQFLVEATRLDSAQDLPGSLGDAQS